MIRPAMPAARSWRPQLWRLASLLLVAAAISCTEGAVPTGPTITAGSMRLQLQPSAGSVDFCTATLPVNRIRLTVLALPLRNQVLEQVREVSPTDPQWALDLDVPVTAGMTGLVVVIELINRGAGGQETVQCAGETGTIPIDLERTTQAVPVNLVGGSLDNLRATSIAITTSIPQLVEGDELQLAATITGPGTPTATWESLNTDVATVTADGLVRLLRNGSALIIARVGTVADTVEVSAGQRATTVQIVESSASAASLGDEVVFTAQVLDPRGAVIAGAPVTWSTDNAAVAGNLGGGRFRALANGAAVVRATSDANAAATATAAFTVQQQPAAVAVTPGSFIFNAIGVTTGFSATVRDARANVIAGAALTWESDDGDVVTILPTGAATAQGIGSATITARSGTASGSATVEVVQTPARLELSPATLHFATLGEEATLAVTVFDSNDNVITGATPEWSSSNADVASVDGGTVRAEGNGSATIQASLQGVSAAAAVTVQQRVATVTLAPSVINVPSLGLDVAFSATAHDAGGFPVTTALEWSSDDEAVASSRGNGVFRAVGNGSATIRVSVPGTGASAAGSIIVAQVPASVTVEPASFTFPAAGMTTGFTATVKDAGGAAIAAAPVEWSSSDPAVVSVDASGQATSHSAGSASITARAAAGMEGSAGVTVTSTAASITLTPTSLRLPRPGTTGSFSVTAADAAGAPVTVSGAVWSSDSPGIVTVDQDGGVTAVASGDAVITVTVGTLSASASVSVGRPVLSVTPASLQFDVLGGTAQLTATVQDPSDGTLFPDAVISWSSANPLVASVDESGLATAVGAGSTVITASWEGQSVGVPVTVTSAVLLQDVFITEIALDPAGQFTVGVPTAVTVSVRAIELGTPAAMARVTIFDASDNQEVFTGSFPQPAISEPGATVSVTVPVTPQPEWPASVYATVQVDSEHQIEESNEENNSTRFPAVGSVAVVNPSTEYTIEIAPGQVHLDEPGATVTLVATVRDGGGDPVSVPVTWTTGNDGVATIASDGGLSATGYGFTTVTASVEAGGETRSARALVVVGDEAIPEGVTTVWLGVEDGDFYESWEEPGHWSNGAVPGPSDVVLIPDCSTYDLEFCTYPMLEGDVVIAGLRTGWEFYTECYDDVGLGAVGRVDRPAVAAAMPCYDGMQVRRERDRAARARGTPPQPLARAPRESPVKALRAAAGSAEYWYHLELDGYTLTLENGSGPDNAYIGSASEGGTVVFSGFDGAIFHGQIWGDAIVNGEIELDGVYINGDVSVNGAAQFAGGVGGDVHIPTGGTLDIPSSMYIDGSLFVDGGTANLGYAEVAIYTETALSGSTARLTIDGSFLYTPAVSINGGTLEATGNGNLTIVDRLTLDGATSFLDIEDAWIDVGSDYYEEYGATTGRTQLAAASMPVEAAFQVMNGARFAMRHEAAYLNVGGDAYINGGSTDGLLTHGELYGWSHFTVGAAPNAYVPSGDHITAFGYSHEFQHQVSFANPGIGEGGSHFHHLETGYGSGLELLSPVLVTGDADLYTSTGTLTGPSLTVLGSLHIYDADHWQILNTYLSGTLQLSGNQLLETKLTLRGSSFLPYDFHLLGDLVIEGPETTVRADYDVTVDGDLLVRDGATFEVGAALGVLGNVATETGGSIVMLVHEVTEVTIDGDLEMAGAGADIGGYGTLTVSGSIHAPAGSFAADNLIQLVIWNVGEGEQDVFVAAGNVVYAVDVRNDVALTGDLFTLMLTNAGGATIRHTSAGSLHAVEADITGLSIRDHLELHLGDEETWTENITVNGLDFDGFLPGERRLIVYLAGPGHALSLDNVEYGTADAPAGEGSVLDLFGMGTLEVTSSGMSHTDAATRVRTRGGQTLIWNGEYIVGSPPGE